MIRRIVAVGHDDTGAALGVFYFHAVDELHDELHAAGFTATVIRGVKSPAWAVIDRTCPPEDPGLACVYELARLADSDATTAGASAHLLALSHK